MRAKNSPATHLAPYVEPNHSFWSRAGLLESDRLVRDTQSGTEIFRHLDVPQLLEHALGLARASAPGWVLRYLYFDGPGPAGDAHAGELAHFEARVGAELRFKSITYQEFVTGIGIARDDGEAAYLAYLTERYFP